MREGVLSGPEEYVSMVKRRKPGQPGSKFCGGVCKRTLLAWTEFAPDPLDA